jgi:hypothetical protein
MNENIKEIKEVVMQALHENSVCYRNSFTEEPRAYYDTQGIDVATALHKAGYRKQSDTVKEFAVELLDKIQNGDWSEDNIYRLGQLAMAGRVAEYIADLAEQFGKEE